MFGFSDAEKRTKRHTQHYIDTHNLYAEIFNKEIKDINDKVSGELHNNPALQKKYVDTIRTTMSNHPELKSRYAELHTKYDADIKKLGGQSLYHMDDHIKSMSSSYEEDLKNL